MHHSILPPGFKPQTRKECLLNQGQGKRGDRDTVRVSAQSGQRGEKGRKGGPRHYDLRAEVWRGCTPKVSEFEGSSEPSPVRFVGGGAHPRADLEGGSVPIFFISVTWYRGPGFDS